MIGKCLYDKNQRVNRDILLLSNKNVHIKDMKDH